MNKPATTPPPTPLDAKDYEIACLKLRNDQLRQRILIQIMNDQDPYLRYLTMLDQQRRCDRRLLTALSVIAIGGALAMLYAIGAMP